MPGVGFSLFWRTFVLLALLVTGGVFAWLQTFRAVQFEPRAVQSAQHVAELVKLTQVALQNSDGINRITLVKTLGQQTLRLAPRERSDAIELYTADRYSRRVSEELRLRLGPDTVVAQRVNGRMGLWVGFMIDKDPFWLQAEPVPDGMSASANWPLWVGFAALATLLGAIAVATLINRPLKQLSFAASRMRDGDLDSRLDENTPTIEIREVNRGFNRMARELARVEEDRAVMLAGISHDLRTPLARLRLETEMSVSDEEAKRNMAMDIDQLDAIIDKFMDYARPGETQLHAVPVAKLLDREMAGFRDPSQIRIKARVAPDLVVLADDTELGRVFLNLFENARRYGRTSPNRPAEVSVTAQRAGPWAIISVRDQGPGVQPDKLAQLTTPFFRGDTARTAATGAGLGLAIVDKAMHRMGGTLELANAPEGGLVAHLRLKRALTASG